MDRLAIGVDSPPSYSNGEVGFSMVMPHGYGENDRAAYMSPQSQGGSLWDGALSARASVDDFEHYALLGSPAAVGYSSQICSNRSSPRSWGSPDQLRSVSWEPGHDHLQPPYSGHHFGGFQPGGDLSYVQASPAMLTATSFPAPGGAHPQAGHPAQYETHPVAADGMPATSNYNGPLSPCSSTLGYRMKDELASPAAASEVDDDYVIIPYPSEPLSRHSRKGSSSSSGGCGTPSDTTGGGKQNEPYAQLIYRAFMSTPRHAMTLQDMYQWFRENTDKGKNQTKGWQNSIRHNLSMNKVSLGPEARSHSLLHLGMKKKKN